MWKIDKPQITATDAFDTCIAGITNADLKQRLLGVRPRIETAEERFDKAAQTAKLHVVRTAKKIGAVTGKEMENLYDRHMARSKSRGRGIYDSLMIAAPFDQCPFCGHRTVSTLDHALPKAQHPALAVTPINLIPCCKDCNHDKGIKSPETAEEQFLNAYFDDVSNSRWLYAEIIESSPPGSRFFVKVPDDWDNEIADRVENHFAKLRLAKLYASQAGRQLQNMRSALAEIYDAVGVNAVREDLERRCRGCNNVALNSWEGALYEAAAANDWYCDGGFRA
jgi:5-methylcytosine-specific restriction endonuclease McrA